MWNRFPFIWPRRPPSGLLPNPHRLRCSHIRPPYKLEVVGGGVGMYFALCDVIVCREMGWPCPLMPHTHAHTAALAELEVCETDLLSAGGLGPLHHFLQTENRGSSQLKPGWDNNEPSSRHHHLISGIIESFSSYFPTANTKQLHDKCIQRNNSKLESVVNCLKSQMWLKNVFNNMNKQTCGVYDFNNGFWYCFKYLKCNLIEFMGKTIRFKWTI